MTRDSAKKEAMLSDPSAYSLGPLKKLIDRSGVTEIMINSFDNIWIELRGKKIQITEKFQSDRCYTEFVRNICCEAQVDPNFENPFVDFCWRGFRGHLVFYSVTGIQITLRKGRSQPFSLNQWDDDNVQTLRQVVANKRNVLFVGPCASGKTSLLDSCLQLVGASERCILIEDTAELHLPNAASCRLLCKKRPIQIDQMELVRQSLRMRPDRILMGEIRGVEAKDFLLALSTGHEGSMATLHSSDPAQAILRLQMLVQLAAPQWDTQAVRHLIFLAVHYLVIVGFRNGRRCVLGIHRLTSLEEHTITTEEVNDSRLEKI